MATAPPPTPAPEFARRHVAAAPALNLKAGLSGCSAGPFACGCGGGANQGEDAGPAPVSAAAGAPNPSKGPLGPQARTTGRSSDECHCLHVTQVQEEMADMKPKYQHFKASFGSKPSIPSGAKSAGHDPVLEAT